LKLGHRREEGGWREAPATADFFGARKAVILEKVIDSLDRPIDFRRDRSGTPN
jgi:hypothetical protein